MSSVRYFVRLLSSLACLLLLLLPFVAYSASVDIARGGRIVADAAISWCATDSTSQFSEVQTGACALQVAQPGDLARGLDRCAFWMQVRLVNPTNRSVERWVLVGHPRLEEVSLFFQTSDKGWQRRNVGLRTPLASRDEIGAAYGVIPLTFLPISEQTVWLRVASRTAIDLSTSLWDPIAFRQESGRNQFSMTLAVGALFIVMILSGLIFLTTHEWIYLFFSISMLGEILLEGLRTGLLQRFILPYNLPMPVETAAFGSFLAVVGFTVFFHYFVPTIQHNSRLYQLFATLVGITLLAQMWSLFFDYRDGAMVWSFSVNGVILLGITLAILAWRQGLRSARTLVLSFTLLAIFELLRLGSFLGWLPFFWAETMAGPWALVMTTPVIFLSISQRSRELHGKLIRAELENSAKVEFLAQMSHELRTPLDTILGNAQLLSKPSGIALIPEGLNSIQESGKHLLGLIDEILDHARGLSGNLSLEPDAMDWPDFLVQLEHNAKLLASRNNNQFSLIQDGYTPKTVILDGGRLRQVLDNLIGNAARHTKNGTINLVVSAIVQADGSAHLNFQVNDSGEGIAPEDQERIFLPFERGSNNTRQGGKGTGMGLTISRQLVDAMGGVLSVNSELGHGSCFTFDLICKIDEAETEPIRNFDMTVYEGPKQQILVVEDDENAQNILKYLFSAHGFITTVTASGQDALEKICDCGAVDLVLVDQFMAAGDGWEVLHQIKQYRSTIPIVMMSSALPNRPQGLPAEINYSAFLLKPLDHQTLLRTVGNLLNLNWRHSQSSDLDSVPQRIEAPDEIVLIELKEMIDCGALTDMIDWSKNLKANQPRYTDFADKVITAAYSIDFPTLRYLAGKIN